MFLQSNYKLSTVGFLVICHMWLKLNNNQNKMPDKDNKDQHQIQQQSKDGNHNLPCCFSSQQTYKRNSFWGMWNLKSVSFVEWMNKKWKRIRCTFGLEISYLLNWRHLKDKGLLGFALKDKTYNIHQRVVWKNPHMYQQVQCQFFR